MKIYARQIPPEYQESPLFLGDEFFPDNIAVYGNRDYNSHCPDAFDRAWEALYSGDLLQAWEDVNRGENWYTWKQALSWIIPPDGREEYTREERKKKIPDIASRFYRAKTNEEKTILCELLEVTTGKRWAVSTIHGCCQSDWQEICYPVEEWSREALAAFEAEYFNTGTEWIIHDENEEPETPEDINGFSCYCHGWSEEQIKKEIADAYGQPDAEVVLFEFAGYAKIASYREV